MSQKKEKITQKDKTKKLTIPALKKAIDRYFKDCNTYTEEIYVKSSGTIEKINAPLPYTLEGLSLSIGLSRETIINYELYEKDTKRVHLINQAKLRIQDNIISRALRGENNNTMSVFILKNNFGYKDKTEQELTGKDGEIMLTPISVQVVNSKEEVKDE